MPDDATDDFLQRLLAAGCLVALVPTQPDTVMTTERGAAMLLGVATKTLRNLRADLSGPDFIRHDGRVWYALEEIARCCESGHPCPCAAAAQRR